MNGDQQLEELYQQCRAEADRAQAFLDDIIAKLKARGLYDERRDRFYVFTAQEERYEI